MSFDPLLEAALVKTVRQIFPYKPYKVGKCGCKKKQRLLACNSGDFVVNKEKCFDGSEFLVCSKPDPNLCPELGGHKGVILSDSEVISRNGSNFVQCVYPDAIFDSPTVIDDYERNFGQDEEFALLLGEACFRTTTDCPEDPLTGGKMPLCSQFVSPTQAGATCRQQALLPGNEQEYENRMESYCRRETTPDCRCINRTTNLAYDTLKTDSSLDDGCWWKWCSDSTSFLVPPRITQATDPDKCVKIKQDIANDINKRVSTLECCELQNNVIYAPDGFDALPINCFFNDAVSVQRTWFQQYGFWILIVFVLFVVIFVIAIIWSHINVQRSGYSKCAV